MAQRTTKLAGNLFKLAFRANNNGINPVRNASSLKPMSPSGQPLFAPKTIKKHYEVIPLFVIIFGGIAILGGFVVRNALTRDDVRYYSSAKMLCEDTSDVENPKQRKFRVYNQKYESPEGLKNVLKDGAITATSATDNKEQDS